MSMSSNRLHSVIHLKTFPISGNIAPLLSNQGMKGGGRVNQQPNYKRKVHRNFKLKRKMRRSRTVFLSERKRKLSRYVAKRQSSKPRESSRMHQMGLGSKNTDFFPPNSQCQHFDFFWPSSISHLPPTIPESLMQIGPGISEIMVHHKRKSGVLGYQVSLAIARSALINVQFARNLRIPTN